jgi:hypothetical protein
MQKAKIVETQNSFIVSAGFGECEKHILKSNPRALEFAREAAHEYDLRAVCLPDQLTDLLDGRDPMLVPINELARLALLGDGMLNAYVNGILDARLSLRAAGIEH